MTFKEYSELLPMLRKRLDALISEYNNSKAYETFLSNTIEQAAYLKYCRGGSMLHRGILCPNFFEDWITGKMSRGRYVNNCRSESNLFKYYYDEHDALICVKVNAKFPDLFEFLLYDDNVCWGLQYYPNADGYERRLSYVYCTIIKSGRVELDMYFVCSGTAKRTISQSQVWLFDYLEDAPVSATMRWDLFAVSYPDGIRDSSFQDEYSLHRNASGQIDGYSYISYHNSNTWSYPLSYPPEPLDQSAWQNVYGMARCCI